MSKNIQKLIGYKDIPAIIAITVLAGILGGVSAGIQASQKEVSTQEESPMLTIELTTSYMVIFLIAFLYWAGRSISLAVNAPQLSSPYFIYGFFTFTILMPLVMIITGLIVGFTYPFCTYHEEYC